MGALHSILRALICASMLPLSGESTAAGMSAGGLGAAAGAAAAGAGAALAGAAAAAGAGAAAAAAAGLAAACCCPGGGPKDLAGTGGAAATDTALTEVLAEGAWLAGTGAKGAGMTRGEREASAAALLLALALALGPKALLTAARAAALEATWALGCAFLGEAAAGCAAAAPAPEPGSPLPAPAPAPAPAAAAAALKAAGRGASWMRSSHLTKAARAWLPRWESKEVTPWQRRCTACR